MPLEALPSWLLDDAERLRALRSPCLLLLDALDEGANLLAQDQIRQRLCLQEALPDCACRSCHLLRQGQHPDVQIFDASLKIDALRHAAQSWQHTPSIGAYRALYFSRVDSYGEAVLNALLKTLEEPPAHLIFILSARQRRSVKATVFSRCHVFPLRQPQPEEALQYVMQERRIARAVALQLLQQEQHHPYRAVRAEALRDNHEQGFMLCVQALAQQRYGALLTYLDDLGDEALTMLLQWLVWLLHDLQWKIEVPLQNAWPRQEMAALNPVVLHGLYARLQALRRPQISQTHTLLQIKSILTEQRNLL